MAFDQSTRNRLQRFVTDARTLLTEEFTRQLQQEFGLDPKTGEVAELSKLDHLDDSRLETARVLREILAHYLASEMAGSGKKIQQDILGRIVREQAFTVLNRLAALRMMEARGILLDSVANGYQSKGFQLYERLAGHALGETGDAYRCYLFSLFDEFALDLKVLFDRHASQGLLFPRESSLLELLQRINSADMDSLWGEDETIGWIYQYFNSQEERKKMRDEGKSGPRNSRELAVRNQFFTPRYVVEFLVDNSLGRQWFNLTGGQTSLADRCQYLLIKPEERTSAAIPTSLRDPRSIKLLDPACGSMHFGLYAFDLFEVIYREAWEWEQQHGPDSLTTEDELEPLNTAYGSVEEFLLDVPRLIIERNLFGVDIDPRATQIASLALWLRAQRAWHDAGVKANERPLVRKGNVVAAVAPPKEPELRKQLASQLDDLDAELFERSLVLLKGLPELGVLLRIEKELPHLIQQVYGAHGPMFKSQDEEQWQEAEARLRDALTQFTHAARSSFQGRLFAQDALEGLRLIDLARERFDVVVMNPPFGEPSEHTAEYLKASYGAYANNLLCTFIKRARELAPSGAIAAITDSTWLKKAGYETFREFMLDGENRIINLVDLGWGVLDAANVATCCFVSQSSVFGEDPLITVPLLDTEVDKKSDVLANNVTEFRNGETAGLSSIIIKPLDFFKKFPRKSIAYETDDVLVPLFQTWKAIDPEYAITRRGYTPGDTYRFFRCPWEISPSLIGNSWWVLNNGGAFSPVLGDGFYLAFHEEDWRAYRPLNGFRLESADWFGRSGVGWGKRTDYMYAYPLPERAMFSNEGHCAFPASEVNLWVLLAYMNSSVAQKLINLFCGQHKLAGYVSLLPTPDLRSKYFIAVGELVKSTWEKAVTVLSLQENSQYFIAAIRPGVTHQENEKEIIRSKKHYKEDLKEIDAAIAKCIPGIKDEQVQELLTLKRPATVFGSYSPSSGWAKETVSYALGCIFGRWDIRYATGEISSPSLKDYYTQVPSCPPGMLQNSLGFPCKKDEIPDGYPIRISWKGIVVDDSGNMDDIISRLREALITIFKQEADLVEQKLCSELGLKSIREFYSSPSKYFNYHLKLYTKSRRKAPIYWPLATSSSSYTLWVYYPLLTGQTLYTAVNDFVEPKHKSVSQFIQLLHGKTDRSKAEERELEQLQDFELELTDLRDTLLQIAKDYVPNHDDGVQITAAPLWPLFRHKPWQKVLKDTWEKLENGDYDWTHLAMNYWPERVSDKCKTDKSLAIAHRLEKLYEEPPEQPKNKRGRGKVE